MSGNLFWQGGMGDAAAEAQGVEAVPATTGEVLGASFAHSWAENPAVRGYRFLQRNADYWGGRPVDPTMPAQEATERFGVPGRLTFTEPVTERVARDLQEHHRAQQERENIIARRQGGIGTGGAARLAVGFGAAILDPLNIASVFIPFVGEARIAAALGDAAIGAAGRLGVRAIEGAGQGVMGALAVEPLNAFLTVRDRDDYTMGHFVTNIAFGAALGAGLHGAIGAVADRRAMPDWAPEIVGPRAHEAALRQSAAAMAEGRPIDAYNAMQLVEAQNARKELGDWLQARERVAAEADTRAQGVRNAETDVAALRTQLEDLRNSADEFAIDLRHAEGRLTQIGLSAETRARIREIDARLSEPGVPVPERLGLEVERQTILDEAVDRTHAENMPYRVASAEQEREALDVALNRQVEQIDALEGRLRIAEDRASKAQRAFDAASAALAARERLALSLAERTIRKYAGRTLAGLADEEVTALASRALRMSTEFGKETGVEAVIRELRERPRSSNAELALRGAVGDGPDPRQVAVAEAAFGRISAAELRANDGLAAALRDDLSPVERAEAGASRTATERAMKLDGDTEKMIAEIEKHSAELEQTAREQVRILKADERSAGEATAIERDLDRVREMAAEDEGMAKAHEAAATCMVRRL